MTTTAGETLSATSIKAWFNCRAIWSAALSSLARAGPPVRAKADARARMPINLFTRFFLIGCNLLDQIKGKTFKNHALIDFPSRELTSHKAADIFLSSSSNKQRTHARSHSENTYPPIPRPQEFDVQRRAGP